MVTILATGSARRFPLRFAFLFVLLMFGATAAQFARAEIPKVGEKAPDFELNALDKSKVKLSALTKKNPVVLVVLRGFPGYQCPICTVQVRELITNANKFTAAKAQVVLVYPGPSENLQQHADEFLHDKTLPKNFRLVLDPDYVFTKKYDLRWDAPNETSYPSTFVLAKGGKILFSKTSKSHGDRAKTDEVLKALAK